MKGIGRFEKEKRLMKDVVNLKGTVDHVIVDPPFLSEECQSKSTASPIRPVMNKEVHGPS